ncbi:hypothetical protein DV515_00016447 [Chloebia gouldiae]|uniref:Uncharacterized protein n=1 Tax=Chloebia gouldiae TaxID=44316 RepID=A0A3L8RSD4_CHLGU|nr:hypothetical protein DV515_00016447 [Chloebia gouldiae]
MTHQLPGRSAFPGGCDPPTWITSASLGTEFGEAEGRARLGRASPRCPGRESPMLCPTGAQLMPPVRALHWSRLLLPGPRGATTTKCRCFCGVSTCPGTGAVLVVLRAPPAAVKGLSGRCVLGDGKDGAPLPNRTDLVRFVTGSSAAGTATGAHVPPESES